MNEERHCPHPLANPLDLEVTTLPATSFSRWAAILVATLVFSMIVTVVLSRTECRADEPAPSAAPAEPVSPAAVIPDAALERVLKASLPHRPADKGALTIAELAEIYVLRGEGQSIQRLEGLEHCIHLAEAHFANNQIQDVTPLATCAPLQYLDLANNQIEDLSALGSLTAMQYLDLSRNKISALSGLEKLHMIAFLSLDENQVSCLHEIAELTSLRTLRVAKNKLQTTLPLLKLQGLQILDLSNNALVEVAGLSGMHDLRWTFLQGNKIEGIRELVTIAFGGSDQPADMARFWNLDLRQNALGELAKSTHLPMLETAGVRLKKDE